MNPDYTNEDLLAFDMLTGGVAKIEALVNNGCKTSSAMFDYFFTDDSFFIDEGRNVLIEEFGNEYGNYFSILSLIASSKTNRATIESTLNMHAGGHLDRLENDFDIIRKKRPFGAKEGSKSVKYKIDNCFFNFWFRFIYKCRSAIEIKNFFRHYS
ncbi:MAG: hypothetical protein LBS25_08660 [Candidatus Symbiothrix sp.]|nr:hypothetical protein [Candidatus Symbiothrix sp.]